MRKLPLPLLLLLLALFAGAIPAQADPIEPPALPLAELAEEEDEAGASEVEAEEPWEEESEFCEPDEEEAELCEELGEEAEAGEDECLLKDARAVVTINPRKQRLRLTVHYRAYKPASVSIAAVVRGTKGAVRLGTGHARFRRAGAYHDSFRLAANQVKRAEAARKVSVDLRVVNSPRYCGLHLNEAVRRPKH